MSYNITPSIFCVSILENSVSTNPIGYKSLNKKITSTCNAQSNYVQSGIFYVTARSQKNASDQTWNGVTARLAPNINGFFGQDMPLSYTEQGSCGGVGCAILTNEAQILYFHNTYDNDDTILSESYCYSI